eukprot:5701108-Prymnesium_polylepis.1
MLHPDPGAASCRGKSSRRACSLFVAHHRILRWSYVDCICTRELEGARAPSGVSLSDSTTLSGCTKSYILYMYMLVREVRLRGDDRTWGRGSRSRVIK